MQSSTPSFYDILEVRRDASPREIRRSYLRLAQEYHPDLNTENEHADRQFKKIRQVYEILSDPIRRSAYNDKPASFHLDATDSWETGPAIITEPLRRGETKKTCDSNSFQPNWSATTGNVGGWLSALAMASLAVAATIGIALMLFDDLWHSQASPIRTVTQNETIVSEGNLLTDRTVRRPDSEPSTTTEPGTDGETEPTRSSESPAAEPLSEEPQWWMISIYDPEQSPQEWPSVESPDGASSPIEEPEWTRLPVPELRPNVDEDTPIEAPEWTRISVPELQLPTDERLTEQAIAGSSAFPLRPEWSEIPVPDLTGESPTQHEVQRRRPTTASTPLSTGSLYRSHPRLPSAGAMSLPPPAYGPSTPTIRREVAWQIQNQVRPDSLGTSLPRYPSPRNSGSVSNWTSTGRISPLSRGRDASDRVLLMSETQDAYPRRYMPPVSRYGGQLPDVPPAYAVPSDSWRMIDRP